MGQSIDVCEEPGSVHGLCLMWPQLFRSVSLVMRSTPGSFGLMPEQMAFDAIILQWCLVCLVPLITDL